MRGVEILIKVNILVFNFSFRNVNKRYFLGREKVDRCFVDMEFI